MFFLQRRISKAGNKVLSYISTMKLKYMISHRVHDPAMKLNEPEDFMNDAELMELRNKAMANNTELPEDLAYHKVCEF